MFCVTEMWLNVFVKVLSYVVHAGQVHISEPQTPLSKVHFEMIPYLWRPEAANPPRWEAHLQHGIPSSPHHHQLKVLSSTSSLVHPLYTVIRTSGSTPPITRIVLDPTRAVT